MARKLSVTVALVACLCNAGARGDEAAKPFQPLPISPDARLVLRTAQPEAPVAYRGALNLDTAGGPGGGMMYPAPNALGLLIGVLVHGALVESGKNSQKTKIQEAADKVLAPYTESLAAFNGSELMLRSAQRLGAGGSRWRVQADANVPGDWVLESTPVFTMTQAQDALVLDNMVTIYAAAIPQGPRYQNVIKVVSNTTASEAPTTLWGADKAKLLKSTSASMLALSLDMALDEAVRAPDAAGTQRTVRYTEGKAERMERAELLAEKCDRIVMRNLRGWVMSVPSAKRTMAPAEAPPCEDILRVIE